MGFETINTRYVTALKELVDPGHLEMRYFFSLVLQFLNQLSLVPHASLMKVCNKKQDKNNTGGKITSGLLYKTNFINLLNH